MDKLDHKKIGLLGGSFNPAHNGHLEISQVAIDVLGLDQVWWMVSPGNPLKDENDMAPFADRFSSAEEIAKDPNIMVTDIESEMDTKFTIDTLKRLKTKFPDTKFVWLMGADNLAQFDQWKDWKKIANTVPFAIFNRPSYSSANETSVAATELKDYLIKTSQAHTLYNLKPPAWVYYQKTDNPLSSTEIRRNNKRLHT
jgi:nicotinate-nucleotide adenylyltransferase